MKPILTKEIAQKMYESNEQSLKDFALLNYPELCKKQLPKSWEELGKIKGFYVTNDSYVFTWPQETTHANNNLFITQEQAEASIAMAQLSQLREVYRDGWKPDFSNSETKYVIEFYENKIYKDECCGTNNFLSFQSAEVRDKFLENFRDLILTAKPLMS